MLKKIMWIKLNIILAVIAILVVLQLISAYAFGFMIQKQKEQQFNYFFGDSPIIKVLKHNYHRGFFTSDMHVELTVNNETLTNILKVLPSNESGAILPDHTYVLKYTTHIEHGLFSGVFHGNFLPILSYSRTNIEYSDSVKKILKKFFNETTPLEITDVTYLNRSGKITAYSPKFDYEEAVSGVKVVWGGMVANQDYNKDFTKFSNNLSIPNLQLLAPTKGQILLHNVNYTSDSQYSTNKIKVGTTKLNVGKALIEWKDKITLGFKLGDVLKMATGINSAEFLNGIDALNPSSFTFNNISYATISNDSSNFFDAKADVGFDSLVTNDRTYGPLTLNLEVNHINSVAFSKLAEEIERFSASSTNMEETARKNKFIKLLKTDFAPILVDAPVIKLSRFELKTPDGLINVSGQATTKQFELDDINDQDKFMNKLLVNLNFSLPKPVVSYLFVLQMKYLLSAGNAELDSQSSEALTRVVNILLDNQVNTWAKKGYLKVNNGILTSNLVLQEGKLIINGILTK
ncbi:MAG: hypothetical protein K0R14_342 [Burkholderiales bacterium]|jgi:uncharacterized protein YdgA (DUF945 family)|nr:hypothetical protein [Burkholderiales bacterium]